ncbi:MAG: hypothetical protein ABL914_13525 [Novosphingobium sp.]|uniref:hypothetical protein n=1 Tax=Novosphingobium sp. TaxID=1874826 RepID=UPI0032BD98C9
MNPALHLLAPLALLFPALAVVEAPRDVVQPASPPVVALPAEQVSIEQRVTIRINPRPAPMPDGPDMFDRRADREPRFIERKFGKCVALAGIAGIQPATSNKLLLIMRDNRLITAQLEKGCQAREFYSGLIVKRAADGQLCVDRDALMSRSGANCQVVGFRQIVQVSD